MKYLIVDDEPATRKSLGWFLEQNGHSCKTACNSVEAMSHLGHEIFDVVITDLKMGRMNGLCLLKTIKERLPDIIVIIITGYGEEQIYAEAMSCGAKAFLKKPLNISKLNMILNFAEPEIGQ
tara:strand:+ start:1718 stop:2083 length:366 start_codon:yes stop_codon:yes gene_type:complete